MNAPQTIKIDEVEYIRAGAASSLAHMLDGMTYVIIRSKSAGCFAGYLIKHELSGHCVTLGQARRLWYWSGAASLSQLAVEGVNRPDLCKFPVATEIQEIFEVVEIIPATKKALKSIQGVPIWKV